jgi:hypothetical protein
MDVLKSQFGTIACVVYSVVTAIAIIRDMTSRPGLLILFDPVLPILILPGLIILGVSLELLGVRNPQDTPYRTHLFVASALSTAALVYLLGAGTEALYKAWL